MTKQLICDFCNRPTTNDNGDRIHKSEPFGITVIADKGIIPINFTEDWLACEYCHQLITAGDSATLLKRSLEQMPEDPESVILIHSLFWKGKSN